MESERVKKEATQTKKTVSMSNHITVRDFSGLTGIPVNIVLAELMKSGVFVSLNERIDYDTAWLLGSELNVEVKLEEKKDQDDKKEVEKLKTILAGEENLVVRPPVIVVMGHVDHGKTKLLDAIRKTNVMAGEAGGITQHVGAYQVEKNGRILTFIDTPGHEAFTAMRSRGAKIADIAILVVAADDGVKPQTTEAFRIVQSVGIPFIIAINKIDKPEANIDKVKQELSSQLNVIPEDWGGNTVCVPVSAREGTGINDLLDVIILTADAEKNNIRANPDGIPVGTVIESHVDKGSGPVATLLVQNCTIRIGDQLTFENIIYGKVRSLKNYLGENIDMAVPSQPALLIGLKILPQVGDILQVGEGEKMKIKKIASADLQDIADLRQDLKPDQQSGL
jgi:translation initiation factor IF-2